MEMYTPQDEMRFERNFYERLLAAMPDNKEILSELAAWYTDNNEFERGLELDQKLVRLYPDDPLVWFNAACSYSLCERPEEACAALTAALIRGMDDIEMALEDDDLACARESAAFDVFLDKAKALGLRIGEQTYG